MKRTTFRGVTVLLINVGEAKRIKPDVPWEKKIPGFPHIYGIRHADVKWRQQQKRLGRKHANEFAHVLTMQPIPCELDQFNHTIVLTFDERRALHRALEEPCHSEM